MLFQLGFLFSDGSEGSGLGWSQVLAFGVVIAIMALMPRILRRLRKERMNSTRRQLDAMKSSPDIKNRADMILVELAEMSREINAQVDTKIRVLNKLIRDAEAVVKRYEELAEKGQALPEKAPESVKEIRKVAAEAESVADSAEIKLSSQTGQGGSTRKRETLKEFVEKGDEPAEDTSIPATSETGVWQRSIGTKILELHKKGYDENEIARKVRMSVAEVSLMLEMLKKK